MSETILRTRLADTRQALVVLAQYHADALAVIRLRDAEIERLQAALTVGQPPTENGMNKGFGTTVRDKGVKSPQTIFGPQTPTDNNRNGPP